MTTIRPNLYPQTQQRPQAQDSAKLAAQRAFFSAAVSQAAAPTAAQATSQAAPPQASSAPPQAQRTAAAPTEQGQRILRPGSLLDIRV
ncbi:MAG TPA: hypothetical protein VF474_10815 [Phenylobacterium sp.]